MPYDRFLIAPINTGYETDLKPWLIPDDAFAQLINTYVFRGRVRKRFGTLPTGTGSTSSATRYLHSRLAVNVGTIDGTSSLSGTVPGAIFSVGQQFSVGDAVFTIFQTGNVAMKSNTTATGTFNMANGNFTITGASINTAVYWYPSQPVMGIAQYQVGQINSFPTYAFDTQFVYTFDGTQWQRSILGTPPVWHGTDTNFFWTANYNNSIDGLAFLFVTNFQATVPVPLGTDDSIWTFEQTAGWATFEPVILTSGAFVSTCRLISYFKQRLLLINTIENDGSTAPGVNTAYKNRVRYSHNASPFANNAFLERGSSYMGTFADGAGFIDLDTDEEIISAEFIKDRLILFCESSSWEIVFTNNPLQPFLQQKINTELGSEATFSSVPFDKQILTMGNVGVHACTGANVQRVDQKIPDQVFDIQDKESGVERVYGIRDYFTELVYWTFPADNQLSFNKYPDRILVYNYKNQSWALFTDCITAFGYFGQQQDLSWSEATFTWAEADMSWDSGVIEAQFRQIVAGNQQGFMLIVSPDTANNAQSMIITNAVISGLRVNLTIINHNLVDGDFININGVSGILLNGIYKIQQAIDVNTVSIFTPLGGTYPGGATAARVSNINITSKQWNPYIGQGTNVYLAKIDFGVTTTQNGEVTVDYFPSSTQYSMLANSAPGVAVGSGALETSPYDPIFYPLEQQQTLLWHPIYFQTDGQFIQIQITMSDDQMLDPSISLSNFEIQGLILYTQRTSSRLQ